MSEIVIELNGIRNQNVVLKDHRQGTFACDTDFDDTGVCQCSFAFDLNYPGVGFRTTSDKIYDGARIQSADNETTFIIKMR